MTLTRLHHLAPSEGNPRNSEGAFIKLRNGRIAFAYSRYRGGSADDHAYCEIALITSADGGNTWTEPRILAKPDPAKNESNYMSVSLCRLGNGDIGLFYLVKYTPLSSSLVMCRSEDEMESFGEPVRVVAPQYPGYYVVNNDRVIVTESGRLLTTAALHPCSLGYTEQDHLDIHGRAVFFGSDDDGRTWTQLSRSIDLPSAAYSGTGLQEPGLIELPGGTLYAYFRTDLGRQYESVSIDGGRNWFAPQPSRFTSPDSPMLIRKNPYSGMYYAVWNPAPLYPTRDVTGRRWTGGRNPLMMASSADGVSFTGHTVVENDPEAGFCYPALHFMDEKTALLAYCAGGIEPSDDMCLVRTVISRVTL